MGPSSYREKSSGLPLILHDGELYIFHYISQGNNNTNKVHNKGQALEKERATHSSVLAWRIPGTAEPGGLPSMGLHRVGHD